MKKINLFIHKSLNSLLDLANSKNPSCNNKSILLLTEDLFLKADNDTSDGERISGFGSTGN